MSNPKKTTKTLHLELDAPVNRAVLDLCNHFGRGRAVVSKTLAVKLAVLDTADRVLKATA